MRRTLAALALALLGHPAAAQAPATNALSNCALIADPTAQRLCLQSAQQARPAAAFDPTAQKLRTERNPAGPRRDALSPPAPVPSQPAAAKPAETKTKDWRLQIP